MSFSLLFFWAVGVTSFTLLGSLWARRFGKADLLVGLYVAFVLSAQTLSAKFAALSLGGFDIVVPAGTLVFAVTFLVTDIVNERFGKRATQRMILIALIAQIAATFFIWLGTHFPPTPDGHARAIAWDEAFSIVPIVTLAGWISFIVSENLDAFLYSWIRKRAGEERHLWLRNIGSTIPAIVVDALIAHAIMTGANMHSMLTYAVPQIAVNALVALVGIPFIYLNHAILSWKRDAPDRDLWSGDRFLDNDDDGV